MVTDEYLERHKQEWSAREAFLAKLPSMAHRHEPEPEPELYHSELQGVMDGGSERLSHIPESEREAHEQARRKALALVQLETELAKYEAEKAAAVEAAKPSMRDTALGRLASGPNPEALKRTALGRRLYGATA